jgi:hypothetical protein
MNIKKLVNLFSVVASADGMKSKHFVLRVALLGVIATLNGCAVSELNGHIDAVNRAIKGTGSGTPSAAAPVAGTTAPANVRSSSMHNSADRSVSFRRYVSGDADIIRLNVEDGAMQLRVGHDFSPTATVDNAMPFNWSASCDLFYLTSAHLSDWIPFPDKISGFSFRDACALNEGGQAFRRSDFNDPIRRRSFQLTTSFGVADTIKEWLPVSEKRRAEFKTFQGDRYFFVGVWNLDVKPYDPATQGFFITFDMRTGYAWSKPIVFVGKQLSDQTLKVNLKTDETLARNIDSARSSSNRLRARQTKVVFKLNGAKEFPDRIELNITLEKVEVPVYSSDGKSSVLVNMI